MGAGPNEAGGAGGKEDDAPDNVIPEKLSKWSLQLKPPPPDPRIDRTPPPRGRNNPVDRFTGLTTMELVNQAFDHQAFRRLQRDASRGIGLDSLLPVDITAYVVPIVLAAVNQI